MLHVFTAIEDHVLGTPLPSPQRCTALLHFERLIDLMCLHVLTYVHTYLPAYVHVVRFSVAVVSDPYSSPVDGLCCV